MSAPTVEQLRRTAWERGVLGWKLLPHQYALDEQIDAAMSRPDVSVYCLKCARRQGKTTTLVKRCVEHGLRNRNHQIRWASPTAQAARDIVHPIVAWLTADCPKELRPQWLTTDGCYVFPSTGSRWYIRGTDNGNAERLRGTACHLGVIDEAGFATDLDYVLKSILLPQTITCGGKILLASTPAKSPNHDFKLLCDEAELEGRLSKFTIDQNSSLSPAQVLQIEKDCGGRESTTFRREYLCEDVTESDAAIVPEWRDEWGVEEFSLAGDRLGEYHHLYRCLDHGLGVDLSACLYGWYNFPEARLYIVDESHIAGPRMTTERLAAQIRETWARHFGKREPHRSPADNNNPLLIQDLGLMHGVHFVPVGEGTKRPGEAGPSYLGGRPKENLEAMVNELRVFVGQGRLRVHPRCKYLLKNLSAGIWDEKRKAFDRHPVFGHYDHLAALLYLVRALDTHTNPIPAVLNAQRATHHIREELLEPQRGPAHAGWAEFGGQSTRQWEE